MEKRRVYGIHILNRPYLVLRATDLHSGETPLSATRALNLIERELLHPSDLVGLTNLWRVIGQTGVGGPGAIRTKVLREAFRSGTWLLLPSVSQASALESAPVESVAEQLRVAKVVKTWVEMEVVDAQGKPLSGQAFVCMMPNGIIEQGNLDKRGRVRFEEIDPGECVFSLTGLDRETWERAPGP